MGEPGGGKILIGPPVHYNGEVRLTLHMILWRQEPNRSHQRQIRILADPFEFHQTQCFDRVSDVDYDTDVRSTLHTIRWRQEPNRVRQRQILILMDPLEFHQIQCSDTVPDVDHDA